MTEHERRAALWNYAMFFHGEDAVADDLAPFIDAAPREEQKYFLATQQVDEARHAIFFKRFMNEVVGRGDGSIARDAAATEPELTWGFRKTFALLDEITGALRTDRSRVALARAVTMYHIVVEALLAQPGQHFISDYLEQRDLLPGFREGMRLVALDEQRHIGFGVKLLHDLAAEDPGRARRGRGPDPRASRPTRSRSSSRRTGTAPTPSASASRSRRSTPRARARSRPSCAPRACRWSRCPARPCSRWRCPPPSAPSTAWRCCGPGSSGPPNGAPPRDPAAMELLFTSVARAVDQRTAPAGPFVVQWEFADAEPWHVRVDNGSTAAAAGRAPSRSTSSCAAASRTGSTSSPAGWTRGAPWRPAGCARTARHARCGCAVGARRCSPRQAPAAVRLTRCGRR